jgi:hypothetical protein
MMEKLAQPSEGGVHYTYHHVRSCGVTLQLRGQIHPPFLLYPYMYSVYILGCTETVFKEKHGVWDPMTELTLTSPYVDSNTFTMGMGNPIKPESSLKVLTDHSN